MRETARKSERERVKPNMFSFRGLCKLRPKVEEGNAAGPGVRVQEEVDHLSFEQQIFSLLPIHPAPIFYLCLTT